MSKIAICTLLAATCFIAGPQRADSADPQMAHMVFFKVNDAPADARQKLAAACQKYLSGHDGVVHFSVGLRADDMKRDVNDQSFDVALHLVFKDKASYKKYSKHPRHMKFVEEYQSLWSGVRVMDSYLLKSP